MEEAFKKVNTHNFEIHLMEMEDHHAAVVSKKFASKRNILSSSQRLIYWGQDLERAHVVIQKRKGTLVTT